MDDLIFYPPAVTNRRQWYRFITCGFIHGDMGHLAFNMISLYFFGTVVEPSFISLFGEKGKALYIILYFTSLFMCLLPTYFKHKNNSYYRSLGASGAVSAVIFVGIFMSPLDKIGLFIIPPIIPGFIFGPLFLIGTAIMDKRSKGNINHSAHLWGAIYGLVFYAVACFAFSSFNPFANFVYQIKMAYFSN
jgi:membrane associated rhomboid family serine protease